MKAIYLFSISVFMLFTFSCQPKKNTTLNAPESMSQSDLKMSEEGFKKATVIHSNIEGDCLYTISVEGESTLFDPINLEENYKRSQEKIWVKYHPLRMPNRCEKANPVEITGIASRN